MTAITQALLPNGRQVFLDANGAPLAGGSVGMYVPGTLVAKPTYEDPFGGAANQNPVPLDAAGSALIYGSGQFRQIVSDTNGVVVWDALTFGLVVDSTLNTGFGQQTALASANTTDLGTIPSHNILITGDVAIGSFGASAALNAPLYYVEFDQGLLLAHNAVSMILPGGVDVNVLAGDAGLVEYLGGGNWKVIALWPALGQGQGFGQQQPLASAALTDLGTIGSNNVLVTGAVAITGLGSSASIGRPIFRVEFQSAGLVLTNSAELLCIGAANITTEAGDCAELEYVGNGFWKMLSYERFAGEAVLGAANLWRQTVTASGNVNFPSWTTASTVFRLRALGGGAGAGGGAGGGNGNAGGGGGSGALCDALVSGFTAASVLAIVIGAAAAGGVGAADGANGADTTVTLGATAILTAGGGKGGKQGAVGTVGAGGAGGTAADNLAGLTVVDVLLMNGFPGMAGTYVGSSLAIGGRGADAPMGFGQGGPIALGCTNAASVSPGAAGAGFGAGGASGAEDGGTATTGGGGAPGLFIIEAIAPTSLLLPNGV